MYDENTAPSTGAAMKEKNVMYDSFDVDGDGTVTVEEMTTISKVNKTDSQKQMAWGAMISMGLFAILPVMPFVPESRLSTLSSLSDMLFLSQAGVVGLYFGATAFMSRNGKQ